MVLEQWRRDIYATIKMFLAPTGNFKNCLFQNRYRTFWMVLKIDIGVHPWTSCFLLGLLSSSYSPVIGTSSTSWTFSSNISLISISSSSSSPLLRAFWLAITATDCFDFAISNTANVRCFASKLLTMLLGLATQKHTERTHSRNTWNDITVDEISVFANPFSPSSHACGMWLFLWKKCKFYWRLSWDGPCICIAAGPRNLWKISSENIWSSPMFVYNILSTFIIFGGNSDIFPGHINQE